LTDWEKLFWFSAQSWVKIIRFFVIVIGKWKRRLLNGRAQNYNKIYAYKFNFIIEEAAP